MVTVRSQNLTYNICILRIATVDPFHSSSTIAAEIKDCRRCRCKSKYEWTYFKGPECISQYVLYNTFRKVRWEDTRAHAKQRRVVKRHRYIVICIFGFASDNTYSHTHTEPYDLCGPSTELVHCCCCCCASSYIGPSYPVRQPPNCFNFQKAQVILLRV